MTQSGDSLVDAMQQYLSGDVARAAVFGEPYHGPGSSQGLHNVHMNQGDPPGPFWAENGIWQDGGVIIRYGDGATLAIITKFSTQSLSTDDQGHPA